MRGSLRRYTVFPRRNAHWSPERFDRSLLVNIVSMRALQKIGGPEAESYLAARICRRNTGTTA